MGEGFSPLVYFTLWLSHPEALLYDKGRGTDLMVSSNTIAGRTTDPVTKKRKKEKKKSSRGAILSGLTRGAIITLPPVG
jgi:hypothetical protein